MVKKGLVALVLLALCVSTIHCEKIETDSVEGTLVFETGAEDAIPLEYGDLVGVTAHPRSAALAALWFEKPDDTIVVVWVNVGDGKVNKRALVIPRR